MPSLIESELDLAHELRSRTQGWWCAEERRGELVELLLGDDPAEGEAVLRTHPEGADRELAYRLKDECVRGWTSDTVRTQRAAAALKIVSAISDDPEVTGCVRWGQGVAFLAVGRMEEALTT